MLDEPNLYRLIFSSSLESAVLFQDFVFEDVLPTIRKTGKYDISQSEWLKDKTNFLTEANNRIHNIATESREKNFLANVAASDLRSLYNLRMREIEIDEKAKSSKKKSKDIFTDNVWLMPFDKLEEAYQYRLETQQLVEYHNEKALRVHEIGMIPCIDESKYLFPIE
jgi:hypothetical protein